MTPNLFLLYLSRAGYANVSIGEQAGIWGVTDEAAQRRLEIAPGLYRQGTEILQMLRPGDQVLAAYGGPQPRVPRGGWRDQRLEGGVMWLVTEPYFQDESLVWPAPPRKPDERWPHRFGIERLDVLPELTARDVGRVGMDALHYSANTGGVPVPIEVMPEVVTHVGEPQPGETEDPVVLALDGDLDGAALATYRREQRRLRRRLLGDRKVALCALCGNMLPVDCLRAAHVKHRARCAPDERLTLDNVMLACTLGCDHLFELGYLRVEADGSITRSRHRQATGDLARAIAAREGRRCPAHHAASEPFFAWHRETVAV